MAVLPWGHTRNQTSKGTEKPKVASLDWFSRSTAEPSRQAINHLMKQHSRDTGRGSSSLRGRSRAGTPSSQHRSAASVDSDKNPATRDPANESAASHARPSTPARPNTSGLERSDSTSKSLFQKGGLLGRKGSKMGMSFNTNSAGGVVVSPPRPNSSRAGFRGRDAPTSPSREDAPRLSISKPFDFAHVMHGDINAFTGLSRIDESDLALQFDAIQARYRNTTELGDPLPQEPQNVKPTRLIEQIAPPATIPLMPAAERSSTPPPVPPPKDSPQILSPTSDVRTSRSTENFSRPTPRSPTTGSGLSGPRPSSCHLHTLLPPVQTVDLSDSVIVKPLPQLPTVVHAVSTLDDTARLLISAPLPSPPLQTDRSSHRHVRQSSSKGSLRHMSTFPSSRQLQGATLNNDSQLLGIEEEDNITRPHSDHDLSQRAYRHQQEGRPSDGKSPVDVEDWEIAIDSAWDLEDDEHQHVRPASALSKCRESFLTIEQPIPEEGSSPSTPLMTMAPARRSPQTAKLEKSPIPTESSKNNKRKSAALVGLGIDAQESPTSPRLQVATSETNRSSASSRLRRSAYSADSHSSSQESIILSIASSILSTQRSSVSSMSVSESTHIGKPDRSSVVASTYSPSLTVNSPQAARPESSCLPPALLQQMNLDAQRAARPDSTCLPSISSSNRNSVISKPNRSESICRPQDMLSTFPVPESSNCHGLRKDSTQSDAEVDHDEDEVSDLPSDARNVHSFRNSNPRRMSATLASDSSTAERRFSSTQGSRNRPTRVSYSLFPSAGPSVSTSTNTDIDGVTS